jgi:hypothetical protein
MKILTSIDIYNHKFEVNQCCISRLGESIGKGLACNFSVTSAENIGISRKMSQDMGLTRNISEYFEYIGHVFNSEFIGISERYTTLKLTLADVMKLHIFKYFTAE